jgi:hypothetical protein
MCARSRHAALLCLLLLAAIPAIHAEDVPSWEAGDRDDGPGYRYQVYTQNADDEDFVRYQVRGTIDATPEELRRSVRAVTADPDNAPDGHTRRMLEATPASFVARTPTRASIGSSGAP